VIKDGVINNYQAVVPSTWNAGPRDAKGQAVPFEAALVGKNHMTQSNLLKFLRTIHSFYPCIACAVHLTDSYGEEIMNVRVV
jgi:Ni,Fe-hydrogenase I large subunit